MAFTNTPTRELFLKAITRLMLARFAAPKGTRVAG
jgi:hypothetical protein